MEKVTIKQLRKWNCKKRIYEDYIIPADWKVKLMSDDMEEIINCPHCGREVAYGETYTSLEIHTPNCGFGYPVCRECYDKEWERRKESESDDR